MKQSAVPGFLAWIAIGLVLTTTAPAQTLTVRWVSDRADSNKVSVEVVGLADADLNRLSAVNREPAQWHALLVVIAEQGDLMADAMLPPMLGTYRVQDAKLRFEPRFPLEPGVNYRAVLKTAGLPGGAEDSGPKFIAASFRAPTRPVTPTTVVSHIYPSSDVLPENLLKFYVHFSAPMRGGHIYDHIHLRNAAGKDVELPFLEIDEELWDPTMTRLTLFIDPGRIKRGVEPLESIGPALEAGKSFTLVIGKEWKDSSGNPLKETFQKAFRVGPPDRDPPNPTRWRMQPPKADTREPLTIHFGKPMDSALARRMIRPQFVSGERVAGETTLVDQEREWRFTPRDPWPSGDVIVLVQTTIEDLAGNNIGKPFDVDVFENVQRRVTNSVVSLHFEVR
jgi:hypothetical protein